MNRILANGSNSSKSLTVAPVIELPDGLTAWQTACSMAAIGKALDSAYGGAAAGLPAVVSGDGHLIQVYRDAHGRYDQTNPQYLIDGKRRPQPPAWVDPHGDAEGEHDGPTFETGDVVLTAGWAVDDGGDLRLSTDPRQLYSVRLTSADARHLAAALTRFADLVDGSGGTRLPGRTPAPAPSPLRVAEAMLSGVSA